MELSFDTSNDVAPDLPGHSAGAVSVKLGSGMAYSGIAAERPRRI